jgi:hypothetical protein
VNLDGLSITQPDYADFWVYPFEKASSVVRTDNRGERYQVYALSRALFPLRAGTLHLDKAILKADALIPRRTRSPFGGSLFGGNSGMPDFDMLMGNLERSPVTVDANDLDIEVLPLPPRPSNYSDWGLSETIVGATDIAVDVGNKGAITKELKTGESATITFRIQSKGNAAGIKIVPLELGNQVKRYDEDVKTKQIVQGKEVITQVSIPVTIVPLIPGRLSIPSVALSYFDPGTSSYQTVSTKPLEFLVNGSALGNEKENNTAVSSDELVSQGKVPPRNEGATAESNLLAYHEPSSWERLVAIISPSIAFALAVVIVFCGWLVRTLLLKRKQQLPLKAARAEIARADSLETLQAGFWSYLVAQLNSRGRVVSSTMSRQELQAALLHAGISEAVCYQIARVLDEFDRCRYGTDRSTGAEKHLKELIIPLIRQ